VARAVIPGPVAWWVLAELAVVAELAVWLAPAEPAVTQELVA
jgi:hypothetical protein